MTYADLVNALSAVDALLSLLANAGVSVERIKALRDANADGHLNAAQIDQLALEARRSVDALG